MLRRYRQFLFGLLASLFVAGLLLIVTRRRPAGQPVLLPEVPTAIPLRVHVTGAVVAPGIYSLPRGSLWQDAIAAAGGGSPNADLSHVNLARALTDGDQIVVPALAPTAAPAPPTSTAALGAPTATPATRAGGISLKVNINTASAVELDTLPGIGPALAQQIIDDRAAHGNFNTIEDIMQVSGIGPATSDKLKDLITVGP
jgi:competence protein ComEA